MVFLVGTIALVVLFFSSNARDNQNPAKQKEMLAIVLQWGRLAPLSASAANISIATEGSSFTRSFRASFVAPKQDIQNWIKQSPGTREVTPEQVADHKVRYVIAPGGSASRAEVTIDFNLNQVDIDVSWS
jgi:hypothetical protein